MHRRLPALIASVLVFVMLLTSCSGSSSGTKTEGTPSGISGQNKFPFVTESKTITICTPQSAQIVNYDTNEQTVELEKKTGLTIKWQLLPESKYADKINLMFSSGAEMPDLFLACNEAFTSAMLTTLGEQKLIEPMNPLIDKWGYYVKQQFTKYPLLKQLVTASDGKIYALPKYSRNIAGFYAQRFWVNQDFLTKLNMPLPKTTTDFYNYLKAVKTKDPNGNGKADEIPLAAASSGDNSWMQQLDGFLMQPFVYCDADNNVTSDMKRYIYMTPKGTVEYAPVQAGWKNGLKYLHTLYAEGLISSDVFTLNGAGLKSLVENTSAELVGSLPSGGPNTFANTTGERRKAYVALPPLEGPDGTREAYYNPYNGVVQGYDVIPTASKNKDLAFKLCDYLFSDEQYMRGRYGVEGRDWKVPDAGTKAWDGGPAMVQLISNLKWGDVQNVHLMTRYGYCQAVPSHSTIDTGDQFNLEKVLWDAKTQYETYKNGKQVPPLTLTAAETSDYNQIISTLNQYVVSSFAEFVSGKRNIDTDWNAYLDQCKKIGYEKIVQIDQAAFNRTWKSTWNYNAK